MPRCGVPVIAIALFLAAAPRPAGACTPAVRAEIVRRAATLMPPALSRQLKRHAKELREGALAGPANPVYSALEPGDADRQLEAALARVTGLVDAQAPMGEIARALGEAGRIATDLSFALYVGPHDPRAPRIHADFCAFVERKLPKIAFTFGGYTDEDLAKGDVLSFARHTAALAHRDYEGILRSYFPEGRKVAIQDFDDRSVAFAAASLEVSLAMTRVARTWLFAWNEAHGDLSGTPFLDRTETRR